MEDNRRKHSRFRSTAFMGAPLLLKPLPPAIREPIPGQVVDLSGGGMAILIPESLPVNTNMEMELTFPNKTMLSCQVKVQRSSSCAGGFLAGIEFIDLSSKMVRVIDHMAEDCNACDQRIIDKDKDVCWSECAFISICDKPQRMKTAVPVGPLELELKPIE